jgi:hypothetical protein
MAPVYLLGLGLSFFCAQQFSANLARPPRIDNELGISHYLLSGGGTKLWLLSQKKFANGCVSSIRKF